jgi:hypothetical protein
MNRCIKPADLKNFLQSNIEPLEDPLYGKRYRAAARLTDGTYLPCVVFQGQGPQVELALRRFKQLASRPEEYKRIVASFVSKGSRLAEWAIESVETSTYAWPVALLKCIHGETTMSWTSFVTEMRDGSLHSLGTTFSFEFFDLPDGYTFNDIKNIQSGMVFSQARGLTPYSLDAVQEARVYREKPFFTCYLDYLK